ncbi:transcription factor Adf-1-like isoform X2 [Erpetoichthys calabaricus]|uniref:transcription factor Adf-1-like isoform X2 n=1 Tax=Erpetoichthys calabaricus TaxID=27687 RepID=UPI0022348B15|nr:transcription factor Adf-1-like isoform X2 [Erpetoichthys calabaricus]
MDVKQETCEVDINTMEITAVTVKEEEDDDCEWESVHPKPENLCIKDEDYEVGSVGIKEEAEEKCVSIETHRHKGAECDDFKVRAKSVQSDAKRTEETSSTRTLQDQPSPSNWSEINLSKMRVFCGGLEERSKVEHQDVQSRKNMEASSVNMEQTEERLAEEVRKYAHLYDSSSQYYKDYQMVANSWSEIAANIGLDVGECLKKWKNVRDKYVRLRKKICNRRSGDPGGQKLPAFYVFLSWLAPHVKHKEMESNFKDKQDGETGSCTSLSPLPQEEMSQPQEQGMLSTLGQQSLPCVPLCRTATPELPTSSSASSRSRRTNPVQRRRRHQEGCGLKQEMVELKKRRLELERRLCDGNDELTRFALSMADMLRRLPEQERPHAMFEIHKLLYEKQQRSSTAL